MPGRFFGDKKRGRPLRWQCALIALLIPAAAIVTGCDSERPGGTSERLSEVELVAPKILRQARAVDLSQVSVSVSINGGASIQAQRIGNGVWTVPSLNRSDYASSNTIRFVWTEQVGSRSLLLAEFDGTFSPGAGANVDPVGQFATGGSARFDVDSDGISNLAERNSIPATDPFTRNQQSAIAAPEMIDIQAGCFDMGSAAGEAGREQDEGPEFNVCLNAFRIGKFEVTFNQYDLFAQATVRSLPGDESWGRDNRPVVNVSWNDATAYAAWLSSQTGRRFRLPTEAEWEYASLAGSNAPFYTGQTITTDQANFNGSTTYNGSVIGEFRARTLPVGSFAANAFGLHDVHGNVWEWTCSVYVNVYSGAEQVCGSSSSVERVIRGGSWGNSPVNLRAANRSSDAPAFTFNTIGFRLAED